ncbi:MAG TPA: DUF4190 domain-containing protein [Pyrinomonadaceae bacterium]|nr:DUF4190 domain-containing protein [Pyrinomonadaceae bacterium]
MKRCPTCNQTFDEEWLSFCTQDGTTLIDEPAASSEPLPTILSPSQADASAQQPTWLTPAAELPVSSPEWAPPQPGTPVWQPPPPPPYAQPQSKGLATAAMILGIISVTVGWLCMGPIPGIAAIIMGAIALSQIKKTPDNVSGKPMAMVGLITGSVTVLIYAGIMIFYIVALVAANS